MTKEQRAQFEAAAAKLASGEVQLVWVALKRGGECDSTARALKHNKNGWWADCRFGWERAYSVCDAQVTEEELAALRHLQQGDDWDGPALLSLLKKGLVKEVGRGWDLTFAGEKRAQQG